MPPVAGHGFDLDADTSMLAALTMIRGEHEQLAAVMQDGRFLGVVTSTDIMRRLLPRT